MMPSKDKKADELEAEAAAEISKPPEGFTELGAAPPVPQPRTKAAGTRTRPLERRLLETFAAIGTTVYAFDSYDGEIILSGSPALAASLDRLAQQNPAVRRSLEAMLTGSVWGEVIIAVGAIGVPIAAHHGLLPAQVADALRVGSTGESPNGPPAGDVDVAAVQRTQPGGGGPAD